MNALHVEGSSPKILVAVTNFELSEKADKMKREFIRSAAGRFDTVLVDSSSKERPELADEVIPNECYTGLWNRSVEISIERGYDWLFFVASDVEIDDPPRLCDLICEASNDERIGVYSPSVDPLSRFSYEECAIGGGGSTRDCRFVEGFCFLARTKVLRELHPVTGNKHGWIIDNATCEIARRMGYRVVVDDRTKIFHPATKNPIDNNEANRTGWAFHRRAMKEFEERRAPMGNITDRTSAINRLIIKNNYQSYLEIGTSNRYNFDKINCKNKICVDPSKNEHKYDYNITSDNFFEINDKKFDIIFVDGMHTAEQAEKDIVNSLRCLEQNGCVVVHDTNPPSEFHQLESQANTTSTPAGVHWNGTVWKAIFKLRKTRDDLLFCTYPVDWGVTVIRFGKGEILDLENEYFSYSIFDKNRFKILKIADQYLA